MGSVLEYSVLNWGTGLELEPGQEVGHLGDT